MKQLTKKQRGEIYLKVSEEMMARFIGRVKLYGLCLELEESADVHVSEITFPEFFLFEPEKKQGTWSRWWKNRDKDSRIYCMLLCYQMCQK